MKKTEEIAKAARVAASTVGGHTVTVHAPRKDGTSVSCTCGWQDTAFTTMGAYKKKREHIAEQS